MPPLPANQSYMGEGLVEVFTEIEAEFTYNIGDVMENSVDFGTSSQSDFDKAFKTFNHLAQDLGTQTVVYSSQNGQYQRLNGSNTYEVRSSFTTVIIVRFNSQVNIGDRIKYYFLHFLFTGRA